jgi:hypothetical protein
MSNTTDFNQSLTPIFTPAEALERFKYAIKHERLQQRKWHDTDADGRWLACALSILGPDVNSSKQCPASIMPAWIAQLVPIFFDNQKFSTAISWGLELYTELARLNGSVKAENFEKWKTLSRSQLGLDAKAYANAHAKAYAYAKAYAKAYANAHSDAYAKAYAKANSNANANSNAYAYIYADAYAYAYANAKANVDAYTKMAQILIQILREQPNPSESPAA